MTSTPTVPASPTPAPKKSKKKLWVVLAASVVVALLLLVALIPTILSSGIGRSIVAGKIDDAIAGSVKIESLSLSWFGGQKLGGLVLLDEANNKVIEVKEVSTDLSLLAAIRGNLDLGNVAIKGVDGKIVADEKGSNLLRAIAASTPAKPQAASEPARIPPSLKAKITLSDASLTVSGPAIKEPVTVSVSQADLGLGGAGQPVSIKLNAKSTQGNLSGELSLEGTLNNLFASDGTVTADKLSPDLKLTTKNLPCEGLDGLAGLGGVLAAALGKTINVEASVKGDLEKLQATIHADAPNLKADIAANLVGRKKLELPTPAVVDFTATPAFVEALQNGSDSAKSRITLKREVALKFTADSLNLDLDKKSDLAVQAKLESSGDVELSGDEKLGDVTVKNLGARIASAKLSEALTVTADADVVTSGRPGKFSLNAEAKNPLDASLKPLWDTMQLNASVKVTNVPTLLADRLGALDGQLVDALGESVDITASAVSTGGNKIDVTLNAVTPRLAAENLAFTIAQNTLTLNKPATVRYKLAPELANRYLARDFQSPGIAIPGLSTAVCEPDAPAARKLALAAPVDLTLSLEKFSMPLPAAGRAKDAPAFVPSKTAIAASLTAGRMHLTGLPTVNELVVDQLNAKVTGESLAALKVDASTTLSDGAPGGLITELAGGPSLPVTLTTSTGLTDAMKLSDLAAALNITTQNLKTKLDAKIKLDPKHLSIAPSTASLTATPALLQKLGVKLEGQLANLGATPIVVNIERVELPLAGASSLDAIQLAATVNVKASGDQDPIAVALGKEVNVTLSTEAVKDNAKPLKLVAKADKLSADLPASLTQKDGKLSLALTQQGKVNLTATNELLALAGQKPILAGPTVMELLVDQLTAQVSPFALNTVVLKANAKLPRAELAQEGDLKGAAVSDVAAALAFDGSKGSATLQLTGKASAPGQKQPGPLHMDAVASNLLNKEGAFDSAGASVVVNSMKLDGLPTAFADSLAKQEGKLVALVGPVIDLDAKANITNLSSPRGTVDVKVVGANLSADAGLKLAEMLETTRPLKITLQLTPEAYALLTQPKPAGPKPSGAPDAAAAPAAPLKLKQTETIEVSIPSLKVPLGSGPFDPAKAVVDATVTIARFELLDTKTNRTVSLANLSASAKAASLAQPLAIKAAGDIRDGDKTGKLALDGTLGDLFTPDGKVNTEKMSPKIAAKVDNFPVALAEDIMQTDGILLAALGPTLNLTASADLKGMQGPFTAAVNSTNAKLTAAGAFDSQFVTLSQPVTGELTATPELSKKLFARVSPFIKGMSKTDGPVKLAVDNKDFRIPWKDFTIEAVVIPKASLDLGQATLENDTIMKGLMGFLKRSSSKEVPAWFTPAVVAVRDGKLTFTNRMDILIDNSLHVATWGEADLRGGDGEGNETLYLQTLGISPSALKQVYKLDNLGPNDFIRVPVKGTSKAPQVNFAQALTDVGKLSAQSQAAKFNPLAGAAVGALSKQLLGGPTIPPASVEPLPWNKPNIKLPGTTTQSTDPNALTETPPAPKPAPKPTPAPAPAPKPKPTAEPKDPAPTKEPAPAKEPKPETEPKKKAKQKPAEEPTEEPTDETKKKKKKKKEGEPKPENDTPESASAP